MVEVETQTNREDVDRYRTQGKFQSMPPIQTSQLIFSIENLALRKHAKRHIVLSDPFCMVICHIPYGHFAETVFYHNVNLM